jgi:hypothetical protein
MKIKYLLSFSLVLLLTLSLYAQKKDSNLEQQSRNPTAALTMFQILINHTPSFHNLEDADMTNIALMPVIPFKTWNLQHIARITLGYVVNGPDWGLLAEQSLGINNLPPNNVPTANKTGLTDMALFDLLIFPAPWKGGRIAAGLSASLPTASDPALGSEKWTVGPALGGLVKSGGLLIGGIFLTNFSFAGNSDRDDVQTMTIQPFGSYGLGEGWSAEFSMMMFNYDFKTSKWTSLPLGGRIGKLAKIGELPVRFFADAEYNFADSGVAPKWTFRLAIVPLL